MNITHLIHSLDPAGGGPPVVAACHAGALALGGESVTLVSCGDADRRQQVDDFVQTIPGLDRVRLLPFKGSAGGVKQSLRRVFETSDVIHMHGVWEPVLPTAAAVARSMNKPYIVTPHGMFKPWAIHHKRLKKKLALLLGYRRMVKRAAALHYLNTDEHTLSQREVSTDTGVVIPNGIFLEEVDSGLEKLAFRPTVAGLGDRPYVLFLSRLHHVKGIDYLTQAFERVAAVNQDACLVLVGPDGGREAAVRAWVRDQRLEDRVFLTGPIYGPMKHAAIREASCFCLPSRQEGFSIAILEALASRCPVVISDACHFPEVAQADAGYVVPADPARIADAILKLVSDPASARQTGERGRALIEARYTWASIADQLKALYRDCIASAQKS